MFEPSLRGEKRGSGGDGWRTMGTAGYFMNFGGAKLKTL
jgi:hypothetical protein